MLLGDLLSLLTSTGTKVSDEEETDDTSCSTATNGTTNNQKALNSNGKSTGDDINQPRESACLSAADPATPVESTRSSVNGIDGYGTIAPPGNFVKHMESVSNLPPIFPVDGPGFFPDYDYDMVGTLNRTHSILRMQHLEEESPKSCIKPTLRKTHLSFWEDAMNFTEGSIPQSIVIALCIGTVCGVAAFLYYSILFAALEFIWHTLPELYIIGKWSENLYVLWIPIVGLTMALMTGLTVVFLGEPGDLAYTIKCVHEKAYISMNHVVPMVCASMFSILGGGSLGPEAPLVAICAALGGFVSRRVFKQRSRNVVRKHTLMGMAGALAAFFGSPLGGSLFALEVNSRFGIEYFEHTVEAIFSGEVCLVVFRALSGLPIRSIWIIAEPTLASANPLDVLTGAFIGLLGAGVAACFSSLHFKVMDVFGNMGLLVNSRAVYRGLLGGSVIVLLGMLIPHTMFWGEFEFQTIATMAPAANLEFIRPTSGLIGFEMDSGWKALIVGIAKIIAISFTVAGGYRGGFIFPFFAAGAAFGRALTSVFPGIPVQLACLCFAASINVSITRTCLSSSIILCYLSGEQQAMPGVLAASLVSLFATSYMPFIKTQIVRSDLDSSLFYMKGRDKGLQDSYNDLEAL